MKTPMKISLALSAFLMLSCTSNYYQTNKYYGYNNNPEREKVVAKSEYVRENVPNEVAPAQQNAPNENIASAETTEVVDGNTYDNTGAVVVERVSYVPVIAPWWERDYYSPYRPYYASDYYYPSSCGVFVSYGYYDYWYSPWYSWNPIYGGYFNPYYYSYYPYYRGNYWGGGYYYSGDPGHSVKHVESRHRNFGPNSGYVNSTSGSASGTRSGVRTVSGASTGRTGQGVKVNTGTSGIVRGAATSTRTQRSGQITTGTSVPNGKTRVVRSSGQATESKATEINRGRIQNTPTRENVVPTRTAPARTESKPQRTVESAPSRSSSPAPTSSPRQSSPSNDTQTRSRR